MLNFKLTTKQTKPEGVLVEKLMIAEALDISRETYFAILLDRNYDGPVMIGSPVGGMDIEEVCFKNELLYDIFFVFKIIMISFYGLQVAENQPDKIFKVGFSI